MSIFDAFALRGPGPWREFLELFIPKEFDCLQVEITSVCSGRCVYCPHTTDAALWKSRHMEPEVFAALWPAMRRAVRVHLQGWGEPFLHPYFFDFVELARRAGCRVSTTTCGLKMDESIAERLVASGVDVVAFSLAGTDPESNSVRAGVPFEQVAEAVRTLQRIREARGGVHLEIHLAYLLLWSKLEALHALPTLMDDWKVHGTVISTLDYLADERHVVETFPPADRERVATARALVESIRLLTDWPIYAAFPDEHPAPQCRERIQRTMYIDAVGDVSPCIYLNVPSLREMPRRRVFGNVLHEEVLELWKHGAYCRFRDAVGTDTPNAACSGCTKRYEQEA